MDQSGSAFGEKVRIRGADEGVSRVFWSPSPPLLPRSLNRSSSIFSDLFLTPWALSLCLLSFSVWRGRLIGQLGF